MINANGKTTYKTIFVQLKHIYNFFKLTKNSIIMLEKNVFYHKFKTKADLQSARQIFIVHGIFYKYITYPLGETSLKAYRRI